METSEETFDPETFVREVAVRLGTGDARKCGCGLWFVSYGETTCPLCRNTAREVTE